MANWGIANFAIRHVNAARNKIRFGLSVTDSPAGTVGGGACGEDDRWCHDREQPLCDAKLPHFGEAEKRGNGESVSPQPWMLRFSASADSPLLQWEAGIA
jgi:hypothetical protein